jgi:hypothetical protein
MESHRVVRLGPQMAVKLSALRPGPPLTLGTFVVLISVRGWVDPRERVRLVGLSKLKNPVTSTGIEPPIFLFVTQCLIQLRYRVSQRNKCTDVNKSGFKIIHIWIRRKRNLCTCLRQNPGTVCEVESIGNRRFTLIPIINYIEDES